MPIPRNLEQLTLDSFLSFSKVKSMVLRVVITRSFRGSGQDPVDLFVALSGLHTVVIYKHMSTEQVLALDTRQGQQRPTPHTGYGAGVEIVIQAH